MKAANTMRKTKASPKAKTTNGGMTTNSRKNQASGKTYKPTKKSNASMCKM